MKHNSFVHQALTREFCFLQLRMLCELIALGCLAAHGDIEATTPLRREWSADKIIDKLGQLHPTFYPTPLTNTKTTPTHHVNTRITTGFLKKSELLKLYGQSGGVLHRGNLKKLLSPQQSDPPLLDIASYTTKISALLDHHGMMMIDNKTIMLCMLRNTSDNNRVQVALGTITSQTPGFKL